MTTWQRSATTLLLALVLAAVTTSTWAPADASSGVDLSGRLRVIPGEAGAPDRFAVTTSSSTVPVDLPATVDVSHVRSGDRFSGSVVLPRGRALNGLGRFPATIVRARIQPQAAATSQNRRLLLAVMTNRGAVPNDATILTHAQAAADYWREESDGAISTFTRSATVKHYASAYTSPSNACGLDAGDGDFTHLIDEAQAQYPSAGALDTVVVVVPESCSTGANGYSTGGVTFNAGSAELPGIMGHEEGHELGLGHANLGTCTSSCTGAEYEDYMSVMGLSLEGVKQLTSLNSLFRSYLGWTQPGEEATLSLTAAQSSISHDFTLLPREADSGLRSIRLNDPDAPGTYFVEYRRSQGRDVGSALDGPDWCCSDYGPGVSVTYQESGANVSWLHFAGPGSTYALGAGDGTWTSPSGGLEVSVTQDHGSAGADVHVVLSSSKPSFATSPNPTLPSHIAPGDIVTPNLGTWAPSYQAVDYQWRLDGVPVSDFFNSSDYWVTDDELGKRLSLTVTMTRAATRSSSSVLISRSTPPTALYSSTPHIVGRARIKKTLRAAPGAWTHGTAFHYQWYAGATPIPQATGSTFKVRKAQKKKRLSVRIVGTKPGYYSVVRFSARTKKVR